MSVLSCAHVHTTFCDGKTPAPEMARAAWERGFVSLGFTSHAPQHFDPPYGMLPENEAPYRAQVRALQKEYEGRMTIYLGIERDFYSCVTPRDYDYFIASVHYLLPGEDFVAVDGSPERLRQYIDEELGGNGLEAARRYYALVQGYVLASSPQIIGHFDLIRKHNPAWHFFDEDSPAYRKIALEALENVASGGALLEVNSGAIARGLQTTPYPSAFLLRRWRELGGEVIINSDCHDVRYLETFFPESEALLKALGYDHAVRLGKKEMWERYFL